jgi:hypothetical protein
VKLPTVLVKLHNHVDNFPTIIPKLRVGDTNLSTAAKLHIAAVKLSTCINKLPNDVV